MIFHDIQRALATLDPHRIAYLLGLSHVSHVGYAACNKELVVIGLPKHPLVDVGSFRSAAGNNGDPSETHLTIAFDCASARLSGNSATGTCPCGFIARQLGRSRFTPHAVDLDRFMGQLEVANREPNLVAISRAVIAENLHVQRPFRSRGLATINLTQHFCMGSKREELSVSKSYPELDQAYRYLANGPTEDLSR